MTDKNFAEAGFIIETIFEYGPSHNTESLGIESYVRRNNIQSTIKMLLSILTLNISFLFYLSECNNSFFVILLLLTN